MNLETLRLELEKLNIDSQYYSLSGDLILDSIIILQNYNFWEVFYFDERGSKNDVKRFDSEIDACIYVYHLFKNAKDTGNTFNIDIV